jgi:hypothetical protein
MSNTFARTSIVLALALAGCEWGGGPGAYAQLSPDGPNADASRKLDGRVFMDVPVVFMDAPVDAPNPGSGPHLLLTEVCLLPDTAAFVEIYNPTGSAVELTDYYLSPAGNYWQLPVSLLSMTELNLLNGQWVAQFPSGSTIAAGQVITVAPGKAADFHAAYGIDPTYSVTDGTITDLQSFGSLNLNGSGGGGPVALFSWAAPSNLVKDVDIMIAGGSGSSAWTRKSKSGVMQGSATYATDLDTIAPQATAPGANLSTKRISFETGHETQNGSGNGLTGHDETSEATSVTWDTTYTAPTPGTIPSTL